MRCKRTAAGRRGCHRRVLGPPSLSLGRSRHDTFMPSGGPKKTWQQMTRREIIASLIAFTVIGGVVVAACVRSLVVRDLGAMAFLPVSGILFVVAALGVCY